MEKLKLEIYDPPMCCSSGVCGPNVNPALVQFSSDLDWLKSQNVEVERFGLSSNPAAFTRHELVKEALKKEGNECLPIILANGILVSKGKYPSRDELKSFLGIKSNETLSEKDNQMKKSEKDVVCGPGCDCGKPSGNKKLKAVICIIVLLAVGSIFAYKAKNGKQSVPINTATAFASPVANEVNDQKAIVPTTDKQELVVKAVEDKKRVGEFLDSLGSLNKVAVNQDAVFVFVPAKGNDTVNKETTDAITSAQQKLKSSGVSIGLYTLQSSSPDYANITAQLPPPGMLVMSKGRGMGAVSGEITETKLLQAYVASSRAGGCCPSGGGGSPGCGPSAPGPRL